MREREAGEEKGKQRERERVSIEELVRSTDKQKKMLLIRWNFFSSLRN